MTQRIRTKGLTNQECCHLWAQRIVGSGETNNGNVFFEDDIIYSYGYHFPMAVFLKIKGKDSVIVNESSYSISTSQQQSDVYHAIDKSKYQVFHLPTDILRHVMNGHKCPKDIKKKYLNRLKENMLDFIGKSQRARMERTRLGYIRDAINQQTKARIQAKCVLLHSKLINPFLVLLIYFSL